MKYVYSPASIAEAYMIVHLLAQSDIKAEVHGESLIGAAGGLPVDNLLKISVADEEYDRARKLIIEWESQTPIYEPIPPKKATLLSYVIIATLLGGFGGWMAHSHILQLSRMAHSNDYKRDRNHDGKVDIVYHYKNKLSANPEYVKIDTNYDGKFDEIVYYDDNGEITLRKLDKDFNGTFETVEHYEHGIPISSETDSIGDGKPDIIYDYASKETKILDPKTDKIVRINYHNDFYLTSADFDSNGDGILDTRYTYDRYGMIIKTEKIKPR